uniref:Nitronate monooxygenase n=1 Tax=Eiseniibacteriota bacterium TaxID=2212470 RepID=A0A832MLA9_UNCEI
MGVGVSRWQLARAVSMLGQLGVVSGTVIDTVLVRRLQDGDPGGHVRRAMERFPIPGVAARVLERYFRPGGLPPGQPYALLPMYQQVVSKAREQLTMLGAFVEVHLAREGHGGMVGINLLTKIHLPNLALLYGAMLAGVDVVIMGAGIPREIPPVLDAFAEHRPAQIRFEVEQDAGHEPLWIRLDPADHWDGPPPPLRRPRFLPIVSSNSLATMLARKSGGRVDGFVVEGPTAGGHNAPPRGWSGPGAGEEPVYGERDAVDLAKLEALGLPFWIAGGAGSPAALRAARAAGAAGIQVGTLFAYCEESGIEPGLKRAVLESAMRGDLAVRTDGRASPTGYPFKVVTWNGAGTPAFDRTRVCDLGYLRDAYRMPNGRINFRCASEPEDAWALKGGAPEETVGRACLCNTLLATIGQAQRRANGAVEPPMVTSGDDLARIADFLRGRTSYTAADVIAYLKGDAGA